jgi:carbamoyltransferase
VLSRFGINADLQYVNHHESHAASAFLLSGFENCSVLTLDESGDRHESITLWEGHSNQMKRVVVIDGPTFGDFFICATHAIGFRINDGEGKTMGLASYGDSNAVYEKIRNFVTVDNLSVKGLSCDLKVQVNVNDENPFATYRHETAKNNPFSDVVKYHKREDVAAAAQRLLEERVLELVRNAIRKTGQHRICLAGGVALNMKLNQRIREMHDVDEVFVFPNPGDPGVPVGAALLVCKELMEVEGKQFQNHPMTHTYYGTEYNDEAVAKALDDYRLDYEVVDNPQSAAADLLAEGKVVGWFQGKLEFGPRALGNRSVLADPRDERIKEKINKYLKKRDWFMPFAPSILSEAKGEYLENGVEAPFMIMGFNVKPDKLRDIPAVLHVDHTARPQTVTREMNDGYWRLIKEFEKRSGVPVLLNTSFNRHGQPMVRSPSDAALHVIWGCVEYLIIHKYLVNAKLKLT